MMSFESTQIAGSASPIFRICTLVTNWTQYEQMRESFRKKGFTDENSIFETFDNSEGNRYEPFSLINQLLAQTKQPYLILCHQDIVLDRESGYSELREIINHLDTLDPNWTVLGNAGCTDDFKIIVHVHDQTVWEKDDLPPSKAPKQPQKVHALDENFLLIKTGRLKHISNLSGFHMYGTDICLHARREKGSCFVVPFTLTHLSTGRFDETFFKVQDAFIKHWQKHFFLLLLGRGGGIVISRFTLLRRLAHKRRVKNLFKSSRLLRSLLFLQLR